MKIFAIAAMSMATLFVAGSAFAAGSPAVSATLKAPVESKHIIAEGGFFECNGTNCVATETTNRTSGPAACRALVKVVGAVESFGTAAKPLKPEQVAKCNLSAK
jgi:hypothetical protein